MKIEHVGRWTLTSLSLALALAGCGGEPAAPPAGPEAAPVAEVAPEPVAGAEPAAAPGADSAVDDTQAAPVNGVPDDAPAAAVAGFAREYLARAGRAEPDIVGVSVDGDAARVGVTFAEGGQRFMQGLRLVKVEGVWSVAAEGPRHELAPGDQD